MVVLLPNVRCNFLTVFNENLSIYCMFCGLQYGKHKLCFVILLCMLMALQALILLFHVRTEENDQVCYIGRA